jgi:subtilase family serine protease
MRLLHSSLFCVVSATLLCAATIAQQAAPVVRIVSPIDEKQLVTLKGTVHPLANRANDRGVAPDEMRLDRIHLVLRRSDSQETALRTLITQMHTPGTAAYHKWLTPDAFGKQFGPADEDITTVKTWLASHGFSVTKVNPGKQTLEFSGNVAQFRSAFHTQVHQYEVNGQTHYANAADPQIPAALSSVVGGFVSLNNFQAKSYAKYLGKAQYDPKTGKSAPEWTVGNSSEGYQYVLAPQDFAVQYDLNPLYTAGTNGTGQTIAIINESNINIAAVNNFRTLFGLPANPPQIIIDGNDPGVDGVNNPDGPNYASVEAYLDVEWSGAVAPNATIDLVIGADTALESGLILAAEHTVYGNVAPVVSLSFGECESNLGTTTNTFMNGLWEQAAAQGMTVMVSSGDSGSAGCDNDDTQEYAIAGLGVNGFGSTQYNVSVGGTDFYYSDFSQGLTSLEAQIGTYWGGTASNNTPVVSIKGVIPEQPWNDSQYAPTFATLEQGASPSSTSIAAGSGGASFLYAKPAWQAGTGVPADGQRDLPDVSLFASNGVNLTYYPICAVDGDCLPVSASGSVQFSGVGGTSASSPAFAGMMALVNQKYGPQGQANFVLYPLASQFPAAFHDVVNGTNSVPCEEGSENCIAVKNPVSITDPNTGLVITEGQIGTGTTPDYNAVAGYDLASGLGTIDANQLVTNWGSVKFASTVTTLTPSSTSFTHGTSVTISGTVTGPSGVPTGNVALMTSSSEPGDQAQGLAAALISEASIFPVPCLPSPAATTTSGANTAAIQTMRKARPRQSPSR